MSSRSTIHPSAEVDGVILFRDLTLGYGTHPAVHHLSGSVRRGSLTAVVGANGSGKSTLLKGIAGALTPMSGSCTSAGGRVAYLPQRSEIDTTFPATVRDLVSLGLWPRRGLLGRYKQADREAIDSALAAVGLDGFASRGIDTLSGGQFQRALFARVLLQDADILLLDEPFNAVDSRTIADLVALIHGWQRENRTIMVVIHDLHLVRSAFPEALLLARRPVAWGRTSDVLTDANLERARQFHEAWDDTAPWCGPDGHKLADGHDHAHVHTGGVHDQSHHHVDGHGVQQRGAA